MATVTTRHVIDDLDGSQDASTIRFSIGRSFYEIDLCETNTEKLYEALQPFIKKARKSSAVRPTTRSEQTKIREWAKKNGIEVHDRGRLPKELVKQYHDAQS